MLITHKWLHSFIRFTGTTAPLTLCVYRAARSQHSNHHIICISTVFWLNCNSKLLLESCCVFQCESIVNLYVCFIFFKTALAINDNFVVEYYYLLLFFARNFFLQICAPFSFSFAFIYISPANHHAGSIN